MMVRFTLRYSIQDITLPDGDISLRFRITHDIHVSIQRPDEKYLSKATTKDVSFCVAEMSISPHERNAKMLEDIIQGNIVNDESKVPAPYQKTTNHLGKQIIIPPLKIFPDYFSTFIKQINAELRDAIKRTVSTVRWYADNRGPHSPFAFLDFKWSSDSHNWYTVPMTVEVSVGTITHSIRLTKIDEQMVLQLLNTDSIEPVYHSLFREAWEQRRRNPRSSLIMAISAIEVSTKHLIERIVPDATWLVSRLQSPPVFLIFKEYLPKLNIDNKIRG